MKKTIKLILPLLTLGLLFSFSAFSQTAEPAGNIFKNGGAESDNLAVYSCGSTADWVRASSGYPGPISGSSYFEYTGPLMSATLCQEVTIPTILEAAIDSGILIFDFHVYMHYSFGAASPEGGNLPGGARAIFEYINGEGTTIGTYDTGLYNNYGWTGPLQDTRTAPTGTRTLKLSLISMGDGYSGRAQFDEAFLCVRAAPGRISPVSSGQIAYAFLLNYNNPWEVPRRRAQQPE